MMDSNNSAVTTTHPVLRYYHGDGVGRWAVVFGHPIAQAIREGAVSFFQEGTISRRTELFLESPLHPGKESGCGSLFEPDIPKLLESCGDETVYDEGIRKGRELCPDLLDIDLDNNWSFLRDELKQILFPNSTLQFKFSKLAIYEPGGHFHAHRDTVRSHDHQATLLVEVKSTHTGGDLILEHNGEEVRWSLEGKNNHDDYDYNMYERSVRYIAFYTDVNHRVQPVLSGVRLALQYDIYATPILIPIKDEDDEYGDGDKDGSEDEYGYRYDYFSHTFTYPSVISSSLVAKLMHALGSNITNEQSISFPLFHLYTDAQLLPSRLKSSDQQIFFALLSHGYHVLMVPVEIIATSDNRGSYRLSSREYPPTYHIRSLSDSSHGYLYQDGVTTSKSHSPQSILYVATGFEQLIRLDYREYQYTDEPAEFKYFQSVFVVSTRSAKRKCRDET